MSPIPQDFLQAFPSPAGDLASLPNFGLDRFLHRMEDSGTASRQRTERYDELRTQAVEAMRKGRFEEAFQSFSAALDEARLLDDEVLVDRAVCGQAGAALELETEQEWRTPLREILVRNSDDENCFLASYNISRAYDKAREYRKALFYARVAHNHALRLDRPEWIGSSHNQIANQLLATSCFDQACAEYDRALELLPEDALLERAVISDSVGYCHVIRGQRREGFRLLFWSLRTLRRLKARRYQALPHISLCFAYLEIERYRDAMRHGWRAFQIAEDEGDADSRKNALYLLGQVANLADRPHLARRLFQLLQGEFYPADAFLVDVLMNVDVRGLVNLRA